MSAHLDRYPERRPWRHPEADPRRLSRTHQALWIGYTPARALRERLLPRGSYDYPPGTCAGRARAWILRRL